MMNSLKINIKTGDKILNSKKIKLSLNKKKKKLFNKIIPNIPSILKNDLSKFELCISMKTILQIVNENNIFYDPNNLNDSPLIISKYKTNTIKFFEDNLSKIDMEKFKFPFLKTFNQLSDLTTLSFPPDTCFISGKGNIELKHNKGHQFLGKTLLKANNNLDQMIDQIKESTIIVGADSVLFALDNQYSNTSDEGSNQKIHPYMYMALRCLLKEKKVIFLYQIEDDDILKAGTKEKIKGAHRLINALKFLLSSKFYSNRKVEDKKDLFNTAINNLYYVYVSKGTRREDLIKPFCSGFVNIGSYLPEFISGPALGKYDPDITFTIKLDENFSPFFEMKDADAPIPRPLTQFSLSNLYLNIEFDSATTSYPFTLTVNNIPKKFKVKEKQDTKVNPCLLIHKNEENQIVLMLQETDQEDKQLTSIKLSGKAVNREDMKIAYIPNKLEYDEQEYKRLKFDKFEYDIPQIMTSGAYDFLEGIKGKKFSTKIYKNPSNNYNIEQLTTLVSLKDYRKVYGSPFIYISALS